MINPKIFNAVLMAATKETKDNVLKALIEHISKNYDYNDSPDDGYTLPCDHCIDQDCMQCKHVW